MLQLCFVGKLRKCVVDHKNTPDCPSAWRWADAFYIWMNLSFKMAFKAQLWWSWVGHHSHLLDPNTFSNTIICLRYVVSATCCSVLYMGHLLHLCPSWRFLRFLQSFPPGYTCFFFVLFFFSTWQVFPHSNRRSKDRRRRFTVQLVKIPTESMRLWY